MDLQGMDDIKQMNENIIQRMKQFLCLLELVGEVV
jgi:hypothetical protein